jgi:DNA invertase Pin-like site-specific DNA recombinase
MSTGSPKGERIKAGMAAARERGQALGRPKEACEQAARNFASSLAPVIRQMQMEGRTSLKSLADGLAERGIRTQTGKLVWEADQVAKLLARIAVYTEVDESGRLVVAIQADA